MRPKGSIKTPGSGRKKGTPNKDSLSLKERARELGVDPFVILLMYAKGDWKGLGYSSPTKLVASKSGECYEVDVITTDHRLKAAAEACQYLHPKRKAIEGSLDLGKTQGDRPLKHLSDEELDAL